MTRLQELKNKLNLKVTLAGSAIVIATSYGSCQLTGDADPQPAEIIEQPAQPEAPADADKDDASEPA